MDHKIENQAVTLFLLWEVSWQITNSIFYVENAKAIGLDSRNQSNHRGP